MKHRLLLVALAALVAASMVNANPAPADESACCSHHGAVTRTVTHIADGVKLELASDDPEIAARLQDRVADHECGHCLMHAAGVSRSVEKTEKGILITATSDDAAMVKRLQEHVAGMGVHPCAREHGAAGCAKTNAEGAKCPHAKGGA